MDLWIIYLILYAQESYQKYLLWVADITNTSINIIPLVLPPLPLRLWLWWGVAWHGRQNSLVRLTPTLLPSLVSSLFLPCPSPWSWAVNFLQTLQYSSFLCCMMGRCLGFGVGWCRVAVPGRDCRWDGLSCTFFSWTNRDSSRTRTQGLPSQE